MKLWLTFLLMLSKSLALMEHEDGCGIYPSCKQYGQGQWEILEDCKKYIRCTLENGEFIQENLECPGDLVYAEEYGECVEYDKATQCKVFQDTPCFLQCPRVYLHSTGTAIQYQEKATGCFRLRGQYFGGNAFYQNMNGLYLSPDAYSTPVIVHWLISEVYGAQNGRIKNKKYEWARCPFDRWNAGWEVLKEAGIWAEDNTMTTTCLRGDEDIITTTVGPTTTPGPTTQAPTTHEPTTPRPTTQAPTTTIPQTTTTTSGGVICVREGPVMIDRCMSDFKCCRWNNGWDIVNCHCNNDFVYSEDVEYCTWADVEGCFKGVSSANMTLTRGLDHTCDDARDCY